MMLDSFKFFDFDVLDSTNEEAKRNLAKYPHGSVICAATQTSGKGRLGRTWSSPPNKNIYMSIVIKRNDLSPSAVNSFVQLAALSIYNSLKEMSISGLRIKWPNDVLVNGAKIAGILCEGVFKQDKMTALIIGIGLNVNMNVKDLSKIGRPATSLLVESSVPWNCLKIKNTLLEKLLCNYTLLDENKYKISELWLQAAKLKDKNVIFIDDKNQSYLGIVDGFTDDGALIMICKNKKLTFYTGELTINS